jgi:hypothetical protein
VVPSTVKEAPAGSALAVTRTFVAMTLNALLLVVMTAVFVTPGGVRIRVETRVAPVPLL